MKINYYEKTLSFCKYLRNESSNLYKIGNFSSHDKNLWISVHALRARSINKRTCEVICAGIYASNIHVHAWIFQNKFEVGHYSFIYLFHKDRYGDIYKMIMPFSDR